MKRALVTIGLAGLLSLHGVTAANAAEYPASPAQGGVDTGTVTPGGSVDFGGSGMTPGDPVAIDTTCTGGDSEPTSAFGSVNADAQGNFTYTAVITGSGTCTLTAQGNGSAAPVTSQVTVIEPTASTADTTSALEGLAATGLGTPLLIWGAVGLGSLGLGTLAVATAGRRA
jgi:hypothetical protein